MMFHIELVATPSRHLDRALGFHEVAKEAETRPSGLGAMACWIAKRGVHPIRWKPEHPETFDFRLQPSKRLFRIAI